MDDTEGAISSPATVSINVTQSKTGSTSPVYPIVLHGKALHGLEGSTIVNAIIGAFTNRNATDAGTFQASINFGDGTVASGTVSGTNGHFTVTAPSHAYATLGKYTTQITITDTAVPRRKRPSSHRSPPPSFAASPPTPRRLWMWNRILSSERSATPIPRACFRSRAA